MGKVYLLQELAQFWSKLLHHILSGNATEGDSGSLARMSQVIESGWKVCVADKTAGCGPGEV